VTDKPTIKTDSMPDLGEYAPDHTPVPVTLNNRLGKSRGAPTLGESDLRAWEENFPFTESGNSSYLAKFTSSHCSSLTVKKNSNPSISTMPLRSSNGTSGLTPRQPMPTSKTSHYQKNRRSCTAQKNSYPLQKNMPLDRARSMNKFSETGLTGPWLCSLNGSDTSSGGLGSAGTTGGFSFGGLAQKKRVKKIFEDNDMPDRR
jgi:hypothetical protein